MTPWGKICRICASPGDYEIFANIPIYLHANCKEYLDWPKPINEMIEETTGLKVSCDDGLPKNICALCISYLKHAKTFREQALNTCLNFLSVKEYKTIVNDKEIWSYDKIIEDVASATQRNYYEDDNLKNNQSKDQDKVSKKLMSNTNINTTHTLSRQVQLSLKYLSTLYDSNVNVESSTSNLEKCGNGTYKSLVTKQRRQHNKSFEVIKPTTSGCKSHNLEDDLPRTTSSDEYETPEETGTERIKNNIFSYKEKNFQEDDIMDLDELKDAITINIPSTCKEHKCSFCFKRFMFEESFGDHIKTCIEYKFATFLEEMNNLLCIRRAKEISPHEFIRRMIFSLRKTCEWLKENCIDTTLPDLLQSNQTADEVSNSQSHDIQSRYTDLISQNVIPLLSNSIPSTSSHITARTRVERSTPINISNNILYEIERSESRNSQKLLKKPIPILATYSGINTADNLQSSSIQSTSHDSERLAFIEKLQNAAKITEGIDLATAAVTTSTPMKAKQLKTKNSNTPLISVRQDLLTSNANTKMSNNHTSPLLDSLQSSNSCNSTTPVSNPCARCPQCNLYFETLDELEIHNAMQHNSLPINSYAETETQDDLDSEHKRIIALFEEDDEI